MKKAVLLLVVLLYLFGVILRIAGQMFDKQQINWKSTLTLGEFDGTQDYGPRWKMRIAIMFLLPFVWVSWLGNTVKKAL